MSYCRWSSDFGQCDVYVYADVSGGWTTHVAGRRFKREPPESLKDMPVTNGEEFIALHKAESAWRKTYENEDGFLPDSEYIDLPEPFAGDSFNHATPEECADHLEEIRSAGFNVPQYAIDLLREEAAELASEGAVE